MFLVLVCTPFRSAKGNLQKPLRPNPGTHINRSKPVPFSDLHAGPSTHRRLERKRLGLSELRLIKPLSLFLLEREINDVIFVYVYILLHYLYYIYMHVHVC